jgi:PKD repeat protein
MTIIYTTTRMSDKSIEWDWNIVSWNWNFGDNTPADSARNPYHTYNDVVGIYQVNLIVIDNFGCSDTTFKQVQITDKYWMYIPNSFTPDLDGINDVFCIQFNGVREETFYFNVYDRFSTLVY